MPRVHLRHTSQTHTHTERPGRRDDHTDRSEARTDGRHNDSGGDATGGKRRAPPPSGRSADAGGQARPGRRRLELATLLQPAERPTFRLDELIAPTTTTTGSRRPQPGCVLHVHSPSVGRYRPPPVLTPLWLAQRQGTVWKRLRTHGQGLAAHRGRLARCHEVLAAPRGHIAGRDEAVAASGSLRRRCLHAGSLGRADLAMVGRAHGRLIAGRGGVALVDHGLPGRARPRQGDGLIGVWRARARAHAARARHTCARGVWLAACRRASAHNACARVSACLARNARGQRATHALRPQRVGSDAHHLGARALFPWLF